jgi:hypothetical protein
MQAKTKRWIKRALLGSAVVFVLGAGLTVYLLQREPAVWRDAQAVLEQQTPESRQALTKDVMQRLTAATEKIEQQLLAETGQADLDKTEFKKRLADHAVDETFELELSNEELLSVASEWAEKWVAQRGYVMPKEMSPPVVMIREGQLSLAFEVVAGSWRQVFSGDVAMRFDPDGMAHGSVKQLIAGSLPMSINSVGDWVAKQLPASQAKNAKQIGDWIAELEDFEFRPVLELEHRRRARVIAMQTKDDSLVMTMRLQDHKTYKAHNTLMSAGSVAVSDDLHPALLDGSAIADVPTATD